MAVIAARKSHRPKGGTPSSQNHRFESFTERLSKTKIDPVRKSHRDHLLDDETSDKSYFRSSLESWQDLNLSDNFSAFLAEVRPLSETLPQLVYHQDAIAKHLLLYIEQGDVLSLEPLLSLTSHFAHDLGVTFDRHVENAVSTIVTLVSKEQDIQVLEWSFNCLTWLFKYLSRLLVPDLRKMYDLMSPLLGKQRQRAFIVRFAAEALSFLIRKAGSMHHKNSIPLEVIVEHVFEDLTSPTSDDRSAKMYLNGVLMLFAESIKGVGRSVHSSGVAVFNQLCLSAYKQLPTDARSKEDSPASRVLHGVLIATLHHTTAETFKCLLDAILNAAKDLKSKPDKRRRAFSVRLLFISVTVRKGTRIQDWQVVLERIVALLRSSQELAANHEERTNLLDLFAVALQYCPVSLAYPHIRLLESIAADPLWEYSFLSFANFFAELGIERFDVVLLPAFKKFVLRCWESKQPELLRFMPGLTANGAYNKSQLPCPESWGKTILRQFKQLDEKLVDEPSCWTGPYKFIRLYDCITFDQDIEEKVLRTMADMLHNKLSKPPPEVFELSDNVIFGPIFKFVVAQKLLSHFRLDTDWPDLCQRSHSLKRNLRFWQAICGLVNSCGDRLDLVGRHMEPLRGHMMDCLSSPSHDLRLAALQIFESIISLSHETDLDLLSTCIRIEQSPLTLESSRDVCILVRRLGLGYPQIQQGDYLAEIIPRYCFGLLNMKLASVHTEALETLKSISASDKGERVISELACDWITNPGSVPLNTTSTPSGQADELDPSISTHFYCTNLLKVDRISRRDRPDLDESSLLHEEAQRITAWESLRGSECRSQALQVLATIPEVAEKRSRLLIPVLLEWGGGANATMTAPDAEPENDPSSSICRWTRKDQKMLLSLFAHFKNPKVLYRSAEAFDGLVSLVASGDVDTQKGAFKAVLTWKIPGINRYEEDLMNLVDGQKFREQLTIFLDVSNDESTLRQEDFKTVMPILLRILYGKVISRTNSSSATGQESKRKAVFIALSRFHEEILHQFLTIALGPTFGIEVCQHGQLNETVIEQELLEPRRQAGLTTLLKDMIETLGNVISPHMDTLLQAILYCGVRASRLLQQISAVSDSSQSLDIQMSLVRSIRQNSIQCLSKLLEVDPSYDWSSIMGIVTSEIVSPGLASVPVSSVQSVTVYLRLLSALASSQQTAFYLALDTNNMPLVAECLGSTFTKEEVKIFILQDILFPLYEISDQENATTKTHSTQSSTRKAVLLPNAAVFLKNLGNILNSSTSKLLLENATRAFAEMANFIEDFPDVGKYVEICTSLLQQPSKRVSPKTKSDLVEILRKIVPRCRLGSDNFERMTSVVCRLFSYFRDRASRLRTCQLVEALSRDNARLKETSDLCTDLNSYSSSHVDEPDFQRRARAYSIINGQEHADWESMQWLPLIHVMLFQIKDEEELATRANASFGLCRFLEVVGSRTGKNSERLIDIVEKDILTSIRNSIGSAAEIVRVEYLTILAAAVKNLPECQAVRDMRPLLMDDDEEASVFTNLLHIQHHRRVRALRRLASLSEVHRISPWNIYGLFIPLLERFVFDQEANESSRELAALASTSIGVLAKGLDWSQYKSLLKRYTSSLVSKQEEKASEGVDKTRIRLLVCAIDALDAAAKELGFTTLKNINVSDQNGTTTAENGAMDVEQPRTTLADSLPDQQNVSAELTSSILPRLTSFLHHKDEAVVSLRVPVAVATSKLLHVLPQTEFTSRIIPVLLDVCNILRSKASETRDLARATLTEIAGVIGPFFFGFILKALRGALPRGAQLHTLAYTMHHILSHCVPQWAPSDLDYAVKDIMAVIMDDSFGVSGQEKDASDYVSKMKEVRSTKSYDSIELVSKVTSLEYMPNVVQPLISLLREKVNTVMVQKIDELLRRVALGVAGNPIAAEHGILVFCYNILTEVQKTKSQDGRSSRPNDYKTRRYLMNMKGAKASAKGATTSQVFKITRFALDLLRSTLRKHEHLQTPSNLTGLMPAIGDALAEGVEEVQMAAMRLLTTFIKVKWAWLDGEAPVYVHQCVQIVKAANSTGSPYAQAAIKMVAAVLRERRQVAVSDKDVAFLVKKIKPDIEEPDRQGVTFNFIRAVLSRKVMIPDIYELVDLLATVMITNQTRSSRDLARGCFFQFLMEYPQTNQRLTKQLAFLVRNLTYEYAEGRKSVMEALHLILTKFGEDKVQEVVGFIFAPLVMVMVNDESDDCREMSGVLLKKIFERADREHMKGFRTHLQNWLQADEKPLLQRLSLQCWIIEIQCHGIKSADEDFLLEHIPSILSAANEVSPDDDWQLVYYALETLSEIVMCAKKASAIPNTFGSQHGDLWSAVCETMSFPHIWIKTSAAQLIGVYLEHFANSSTPESLAGIPLVGPGGLRLDGAQMMRLSQTSLQAFWTPGAIEKLIQLCAKNLVYLATFFAANNLKESNGEPHQSELEEDDSSSTSSDDEAGAVSETPKQGKLALQRLLERLSKIIRRQTSTQQQQQHHASSSARTLPKTASLSILAALCHRFDAETLKPHLLTIMLPLHNLVDTTINKTTTSKPPDNCDDDNNSLNRSYKDLRDSAQGILDALREKLGVVAFAEAYGSVRAGVKKGREERRAKRKMSIVRDPERGQEVKRRKREAERRRRKERNVEMRGRRRGW